MRKLCTLLALSAAGLGLASAYSIKPSYAPKEQPQTNRDYISPNGKISPQALKELQKAPKLQKSRLGVISPDATTFFCGFDDEAQFNEFTVHNSNNDENLWHWQGDDKGGQAIIGYNSSMAMDDWLISPAFHLEAGQRYILTIDAKCSSSNYPEKIELFVGQGDAISDASVTLLEPTNVSNLEFAGYGGYFTPETSGDYRIMIHGISPADMSSLIVDNIRVSSPGAVGIPGEDAIAYNEHLLYEADFSQVPGSEDNPVAIEGEGHYLTGLDGWRGLDCYGIGGAVMIDFINPATSWPQLAPKKVNFTPTDDGSYNGRIEIEAKVMEWSQQALDFNYYEGLMFTGMVGSSQCPSGWCWGGYDSDYTGSLSSSEGNWTPMAFNVAFSGNKDLIDDNFDNVYDMVMLGSFPVDNISGRMTSLCNSKLAVRSYRVIEKVPVISPVKSWETTAYSADGFSMKWHPSEGATRYVVTLFEGEADGSYPVVIESKTVSSTECSFNVDTRDGRFLFVNMYACNDEIRSPLSPTYRVFQVNAPSFGPLEKPVNGTLEVPVSWDPATHAVEIYALGGKKNTDAVSDYVINEFSFAGRPDYDAENDENAEYTTVLDEPGWSIYPLISFSDGAAKRNNSSATWGMVDYMTVAGDCAYDFSNIDGKIRVKVTAKTEGFCTMTANLMEFDDVERYYKPFASSTKDLTNSYQTLEFELDPQGKSNVCIWITTSGQDTNYIKDVKVSCDLPAGASFLRPLVCGAVDVTGSADSKAKINIENIPADLTDIRVTGQAYRGLYDMVDGQRSLVYNARSPFASPADLSLSTSEVTPMQMPFFEGFDNKEYTNGEWLIVPVDGETATVSLVDYDPSTGLYPDVAKRDKGFMRIENDKAGAFYLMSPPIKVAPGMDDANVGWSYFRNPAITAEGAVQYEGEEIIINTTLNDWGSDAMDPRWTSISTTGWPPFGSQTGKVIRFGWKITTNGEGGVFCIDNFMFGVKCKYDLGLVRPHATPAVKQGDKLKASVEVGVYGELTTTKFNVQAYLDGVKVGEFAHPENGPWGERKTLCEFDIELPSDIAIGEHEMSYEVNFEGDYAGSDDGDLSNNKASVKFNVISDYLPGATDLTANCGKLSWNVPAAGTRFTDDIESLESFDDGSLDVVYDLHPIYEYDVFTRAYGNTGAIGGYQVIDGDQKPTAADDNWADLCVPNVFHLMACTVADFSVETEGLSAASGNKAFLFWSNADGSESDNYLVLPKLNASDRKLSFKARAFDNDYPEKIEIMTSSTGSAADCFVVAESIEINQADFKTVEFEAPAGTSYVAIHHVSDEGYALVVDDLNYAMEPREVKGYNIYREGELVATVNSPEFSVTEDGNYSVSVVYANGESSLSAPVYVSTSGIVEIDADADGETVYFNMQGIRIENPGKGVYIKVRNGKAVKEIRK